METAEFRPEFLQLAMRDHEIIARYVANVEKLFAGARAQDLTTEIEELDELVSKKLLDHFAYEEATIFPALLAGPASDAQASLTRSLQAEHQTMREKVAVLQRAMADQARGDRRSGLLHEAAIDLFGMLMKHVSEENTLFQSLLQGYWQAL